MSKIADLLRKRDQNWELSEKKIEPLRFQLKKIEKKRDGKSTEYFKKVLSIIAPDVLLLKKIIIRLMLKKKFYVYFPCENFWRLTYDQKYRLCLTFLDIRSSNMFNVEELDEYRRMLANMNKEGSVMRWKAEFKNKHKLDVDIIIPG